MPSVELKVQNGQAHVRALGNRDVFALDTAERRTVEVTARRPATITLVVGAKATLTNKSSNTLIVETEDEGFTKEETLKGKASRSLTAGTYMILAP